MSTYPMHFLATSQATDTVASPWVAQTADQLEIKCSIPREFGGPNDGLSPEDLFLQALMNCYIATLKVIAQNSKMSFQSISGEASLTLDRGASDPTPWMQTARLHFKVTGTENPDRFKRLMERVSKQCMVLNSVKTAIDFAFEVA